MSKPGPPDLDHMDEGDMDKYMSSQISMEDFKALQDSDSGEPSLMGALAGMR